MFYLRFEVVRRPLDVPPDREIGFVSFVRASGRGEAACLRERVMLLNAGLPILEFSSVSFLLPFL